MIKYTDDSRLALLKDLSSKLTKQKNVFLKKQMNDSDNLIASYEVCLELVKQKKSV